MDGDLSVYGSLASPTSGQADSIGSGARVSTAGSTRPDRGPIALPRGRGAEGHPPLPRGREVPRCTPPHRGPGAEGQPPPPLGTRGAEGHPPRRGLDSRGAPPCPLLGNRYIYHVNCFGSRPVLRRSGALSLRAGGVCREAGGSAGRRMSGAAGRSRGDKPGHKWTKGARKNRFRALASSHLPSQEGARRDSIFCRVPRTYPLPP